MGLLALPLLAIKIAILDAVRRWMQAFTNTTWGSIVYTIITIYEGLNIAAAVVLVIAGIVGAIERVVEMVEEKIAAAKQTVSDQVS